MERLRRKKACLVSPLRSLETPSGMGRTVSLPRMPCAVPTKKKPQPPAGVSAACIMTLLAVHVPVVARLQSKTPQDGEEPPRITTRRVTAALKQEMKEVQEEGPVLGTTLTEPHYVTGGQQIGPASIHVAHAWDASFEDLCDCIGDDAAEHGDWERMYALDFLTTDLHATCLDAALAMEASVNGAAKVLLVLDQDALALRRLCVVFEAILAHSAGKLVVRCSGKDGFGNSVEALRRWETHIDGADWAMAETSRKQDDKKLREYAETNWEIGGKGIERMLARFKIDLRKEVYGQILVAAVEAGKLDAVQLALDLGADPEFKDKQGNLPEDLAFCNGRDDIAELVFERRMAKLPCQSLRAILREMDQGLDGSPYLTEMRNPQDLKASCATWGSQGFDDRPFSARSEVDSFDWAQLAVT